MAEDEEDPRTPPALADPAWLAEARQEITEDLKAIAHRYRDRVEWREGRLRAKPVQESRQ